RKRVVEGVPADAFGYTGSCGRRSDESFHDGLGPVWLQALFVWRSPNPIFGSGIDGLLSPYHEHVCNVLIHWDMFAGSLRFTRACRAIHHRMTLIRPPMKSRSSHLSPIT